MRCIVGLVLFLFLYFGSCKLLREIAGAMAVANDPAHSQRVGRAVGARAVKKYHALVAVGAGAVAFLSFSLPVLLVRSSERNEESAWHRYAEDLDRSYR